MSTENNGQLVSDVALELLKMKKLGMHVPFDPDAMTDKVKADIVEYRESGMSISEVADLLIDIDPSRALVWLTDCALANVAKLTMTKSASKSELRRQINKAQDSTEWMDRFGVDYSGTRAADVKALGGSVEKWAEQFKALA